MARRHRDSTNSATLNGARVPVAAGARHGRGAGCAQPVWGSACISERVPYNVHGPGACNALLWVVETVQACAAVHALMWGASSALGAPNPGVDGGCRLCVRRIWHLRKSASSTWTAETCGPADAHLRHSVSERQSLLGRARRTLVLPYVETIVVI